MASKQLENELNLNDYFKTHPEEEIEFIEEMARLHAHDDPIEMPEEWPLNEWLKFA